MDKKKENERKETVDIEIPTLDEQINNWCTVPEEGGRKNAGDLEVDAWCDNSTVEEELKKKKK